MRSHLLTSIRDADTLDYMTKVSPSCSHPPLAPFPSPLAHLPCHSSPLPQLTDRYRELIAQLPVSASRSELPSPTSRNSLNNWADVVSELDYVALIYHHCRLGGIRRADQLHYEMEQRLDPSILTHAILLHHSASLEAYLEQTRERLRLLVELAYLTREGWQGSTQPSIPLPIPLLATVVYPYADPRFSSVIFTPAASRRQYGWPPEMLAEHAKAGLSCYRFLQGEGLLEGKDTGHVYLRLMRLLIQARLYVPCRSVYADMVARGIRETAEGYRLLMTSLVGEVEDPAVVGVGEVERDEDGVVWRKRQLVKLKLMTLAQQMTRSRLALTNDHFGLLIHATCRVHDARHALQYRQLMKARGVQHTPGIYHSLLSLPALDAAIRDALIEEMKVGCGVDMTAYQLLVRDAVRRKDLGAVLAFLEGFTAGQWRTSKGVKAAEESSWDVLLPLYVMAAQAAVDMDRQDDLQSIKGAFSARFPWQKLVQNGDTITWTIRHSTNKSTESWIICDHCKKWRLLPSHSPTSSPSSSLSAHTPPLYFCGGGKKPRPDDCARMDDWIVRCVGEVRARQLNEVGVSTVEGMERSSVRAEKEKRMERLGMYFDRATQKIKSM